MKELKILPNGWPLTIKECPPGFFVKDDQLCLKTECHTNDGDPIAYNSEGEYYLGDKDELIQPALPEWGEVDDYDN